MYRKKRRTFGRKRRTYHKKGYGKKVMKKYYVARGGIRL